MKRTILSIAMAAIMTSAYKNMVWNVGRDYRSQEAHHFTGNFPMKNIQRKIFDYQRKQANFYIPRMSHKVYVATEKDNSYQKPLGTVLYNVMPKYGNGISGNSIYSPRVQRIKDLSQQKEILKDVTASEFALQLEIKSPEPETDFGNSNSTTSSAAIDYDKLIRKLDENLEIIRRRPELNNLPPSELKAVGETLDAETVLLSNMEEYNSNNLTARIIRIKEDLTLVSQKQPPKYAKRYIGEVAQAESAGPGLEASNYSASITSTSSGIPGRRGFRILVREDGYAYPS
jgi:hypothetical protein